MVCAVGGTDGERKKQKNASSKFWQNASSRIFSIAGAEGEAVGLWHLEREVRVMPLRLIRGRLRSYLGRGDSTTEGGGSPQTPVRDPALDVDRSDKIALIRRYLGEGNRRFFLNILGAKNDIVMWVDWRAHGEDVVDMCEALIQTGTLTAETVDNDTSASLTITYRGVETRVPYKNANTDLDAILIALNTLLAPDHEIRFCRDSDGNDTVAFLPLSSAQWQSLDASFPKEAEAKFMRITADMRLFGE
jgi:hypothetical protein